MSVVLERKYNIVDKRKIVVFKGEVWLADLGHGEGSEQSGIRPVLVIQNDTGNFFAPTTQVAPISSSTTKKPLPTHVKIDTKTGLEKESTIFLEQIRTIDKQRLITRITKLNKEIMDDVDSAIKISFGL